MDRRKLTGYKHNAKRKFEFYDEDEENSQNNYEYKVLVADTEVMSESPDVEYADNENYCRIPESIPDLDETIVPDAYDEETQTDLETLDKCNQTDSDENVLMKKPDRNDSILMKILHQNEKIIKDIDVLRRSHVIIARTLENLNFIQTDRNGTDLMKIQDQNEQILKDTAILKNSSFQVSRINNEIEKDD